MDKIHLQKIQNVLDDAVAKKKFAGANCLVFKDGIEQGYWQAGFCDAEEKKEFSREVICRLYSMTKAVTSVAALVLLEQGKLDLYDNVCEYIPAFSKMKVCAKQKIRKAQNPILIQDLMNMTSGFSYGGENDESERQISHFIFGAGGLAESAQGPNNITTRAAAETFAKMPLSFEPGTNFQYGISADILGAVIEEIAQMKFGDFLKKNIFEPLEMSDTDFFVPDEKQNRLAKVYEKKDGDLRPFFSCHLGIQNDMKKMPAFESGGAGLVSTIDDYMKFTRMLCNLGELNGTRILKERTAKFLSEARLTSALQRCFEKKMPNLPGYSYANLCRVCIKPGQCRALSEKGEFGWDGWLGPYMSVDIKNHLCIVLMMQKTDAGTTCETRKIKNIVYSSL